MRKIKYQAQWICIVLFALLLLKEPPKASCATIAMPSETAKATSIPIVTETPSPDASATSLPITTVKPSAKPKGLVKEGTTIRFYQKGEPIKNQWKTIKGKKYYFMSNGTAATKSYKIKGDYYVFDLNGIKLSPSKKSIVKVGNSHFYVTPKGKPVPGWVIVKNKLYYVYKNGRCAANETVNKISFTSTGSAKNNSISKLKKKTMSVVSKITKPGMDKKTKLKKCWYYVNRFRYKPNSYPDKSKKNWKYQCALDMLNKKAGNCYGVSHAFAALAKEIGYSPYVIEVPRTHCWVRINGKYWDNMGNRIRTSKSGRKYKKNQISKFW